MGGRGLACVALSVAMTAACLDAPPTSVRADSGRTDQDDGPSDPLLVGLIGWYRMDEVQDGGSGTMIAPDATGGGDGTCFESVCPALVTGHIGGAYQYDGIDDEITVPDRAQLHTESGTIAVWVYLTGTGTMIISKPYGTQDGDSWLLYADSDGSILFETAGGRHITETGLVSMDQWLHLALTWSPAGNALYIDGSFVITGELGTAFDDNPVVLGADHDFGEQVLPMDGLLDDVRIYDRALDEDEIAALFAM